jgi:hypothetical protein
MADPITTILTTAAEHAPSAAAVTVALKAAKDFLAKVTGPAVDELGEIGRDYVKGWRAKNSSVVLAEADKLLSEAGREPQAVPPKILLPLLENASLEDDNFLQRTWASLLANAASPDKQESIEVGFVEIMKQINTTQVMILNALFPEARGGVSKQTHLFQMDTEYIREVVISQGVSQKQFDIAFDNLVRLRLCTASGMTSLMQATREMMATQQENPAALAMAMGNGTANIGPTWLGISFLQACSPPESKASAG